MRMYIFELKTNFLKHFSSKCHTHHHLSKLEASFWVSVTLGDWCRKSGHTLNDPKSTLLIKSHLSFCVPECEVVNFRVSRHIVIEDVCEPLSVSLVHLL